MPIKIAINHVTHYTYGHPVSLGPQIIRLRPAPHCRSRIISYTLTVEPASHLMHWQQDPFANYQARCVFPEKTTEFKVTVDLVAEMLAYNPFDFFLDAIAEQFPFQYDALTTQDLANASLAARFLPRFSMAIGATAASLRVGGTLCIGLSRST